MVCALMIRVRLFPLRLFFPWHEVRHTGGGLANLHVVLRRWSCDTLDPSEPSKPEPALHGELHRLNRWGDGNKQREDLHKMSFLINVPGVGAYLAKTKRELVVRRFVSGELYNADPVRHRVHDDRHELDKWIVISNCSPIPH